MYYSFSETGILLGVCPATIRRWDKEGKTIYISTQGNHRRIHKENIQRIIEEKRRRYKERKRAVTIYGRIYR